ncbi:synapse differentiation-inducing gene protein 1-like [Xenopus tropicalis]|uniref:Synapse differentiation-inducing gene protein 1-like n=1 Tax=Xenopus tropicalis TaxID=8364 RepID=A0A8J1JZB4_XENTR|nr:synapse differentiation-inducing gene protein 1-like [Xenopus tropicalis]
MTAERSDSLDSLSHMEERRLIQEQESDSEDAKGKAPPPYDFQPTASVSVGNPGPPEENVKDYLVVSIMNMLCCCLPIGVAALVYSIQTREAVARRDTASAKRSSQNALHLNVTAFAVGFFFVTLMIIFYIFKFKLMATLAANQESTHPRFSG